jgi:protoporphyrinogen oxidase
LKKLVIIGAGLTGLSVAYHLDKGRSENSLSYHILEKCDRPGGLCKTENENGFSFDYTGHLLHFRTPYVENLVMESMGPDLFKRKRSAWIFSKGTYTKYPFQANLHGLPESVVEECVYEFCLSYLDNNKREIKTFHDWIIRNFGNGIGRHFMIPYNQKLWRRHPEELTCDWLGRFVPKPDLKTVIRGALSGDVSDLGYNVSFYYPKTGGIESLVKNLSGRINNIDLNQEVIKINVEQRKVYTHKGKIYPFDVLVSTLPITDLVNLLDDKPREVLQAANDLNCVSVLNINLGIKGNIKEKHWVYIPEHHFLFYRIGFPNNFSNETVPPGHSSIYTEISYDPGCRIDQKEAREKVIADLLSIGVLKKRSDIVTEKIMDIPCAYVIFDKKREQNLAKIRSFLKRNRVYSAGRYGEWKYSSMEDAVLDGEKIASELIDICSKGQD